MATLTQWQILTTLTRRNQGTQQILDKLRSKGVTVTLRSVQRNLDKLSQKFPIASDHKKPAGWKWVEDHEFLDIPGMDCSTALTLRLSEQYLAEMLPKSCLNTLLPYISRAHQLLNEMDHTGIGEWPNRIARISRQQPLRSPEIDPDILDSVFQAVLDIKQLKISYRNLEDEEPCERILHPLGLVFDSGIIYLVATVWDYADFRQFALHRICSAEILPSPAKVNDAFCLDKYIADGNFNFPSPGGETHLKLLVQPWLARHLEERKLSDDQSIEEIEEGFLVEASVIETAQLKWWLLGLETQVEVLEPESLRQSISTTIEDLHSIYTPKDRN